MYSASRFYADDEVIAGLVANDQVLFRYTDGAGDATPEANLNGSVQNIAGICNAGRNVFGMMPHPERASEPEIGNTDGRAIFAGMIKAIEAAAVAA